MKTCRKCGADKPLEGFHRDRRSPDGRTARCAECRTAEAGDYQRRNAARVYAKNARWMRANPEARRAKDCRRAARRRGAGSLSHVDPLVVLEASDGACGICGDDVDPLRFQVDHVVPLARGGAHAYHNLQAAHAVCNARKGAAL